MRETLLLYLSMALFDMMSQDVSMILPTTTTFGRFLKTLFFSEYSAIWDFLETSR